MGVDEVDAKYQCAIQILHFFLGQVIEVIRGIKPVALVVLRALTTGSVQGFKNATVGTLGQVDVGHRDLAGMGKQFEDPSSHDHLLGHHSPLSNDIKAAASFFSSGRRIGILWNLPRQSRD
jgi:hypothetical protein